MFYAVAAEIVLVVHLAFVIFVGLGGLLVLRWPAVAWLHVPSAAWGALISLVGWICPLTPLENALRMRAGQDGYEGDFVAHYLLPLIYPEGLTRTAQIAVGLAVLAVNAAIYLYLLRRYRRAGRL
jgi:hypothetical protein